MSVVYPKLRPEVKEAWLRHLRSGEFVQGRGYLKISDNSYCCLGVVAEAVLGLEGILHKNECGCGCSDDLLAFFTFEECSTSLSDDHLHSMFDLREGQSDLHAANEACEYLIAMNDTAKNTFPEIADWIEENL